MYMQTLEFLSLSETQGWEEACRHRNARDYCWEHFLSHNTLEVRTYKHHVMDTER